MGARCRVFWDAIPGDPPKKRIPTWSWLSLVAQIARRKYVSNWFEDLHYYSQFDIEVSAKEWKPVKHLLQELQPESRITETHTYGLRIYGPWFSGRRSTGVTNLLQGAWTIISKDQESKDRAADARVTKIWADEPHLVITEFLKNHSTMIF